MGTLSHSESGADPEGQTLARVGSGCFSWGAVGCFSWGAVKEGS